MPQNKSGQPCQMCQGSGGVVVGATAQPCPVCEGSGKAYQPGLYYTYPFNVVLTALQAVQSTINITNAPFKWIFSTKSSTGAFTIQLQDAKNGRKFFDSPLHSDLVFGSGTQPFPILNPWTFDMNSSIQLQLTDLSNAGNTVWLGFVGVQLVGQ